VEVVETSPGVHEVQIDVAKKNVYDDSVDRKALREEKISKGRVKRAQCDRALSYITDSNSENELTEVQIDQMIEGHKALHDALVTCHIKKARRLAKDKESDPILGQLAKDIGEILK
jgi:hypothetical protein